MMIVLPGPGNTRLFLNPLQIISVAADRGKSPVHVKFIMRDGVAFEIPLSEDKLSEIISSIGKSIPYDPRWVGYRA